MARKLTILARLSGLPVESPTSFPVRSLIPKPLEDVKSGEEFLSRLGDYDGEMGTLKEEAEAEGKVIRYVGSIDLAKKDVRVGLEKYIFPLTCFGPSFYRFCDDNDWLLGLRNPTLLRR